MFVCVCVCFVPPAKTPGTLNSEYAVPISMAVLMYMSFPSAYFGRKDAHHNVWKICDATKGTDARVNTSDHPDNDDDNDDDAGM